jgi:hypothetical protein
VKRFARPPILWGISTPTVSIEDFCVALYCAYTRPDALNPDAAGRIAFTARVGESSFRAEFEGVREYAHNKGGQPLEPQDQLELSVVELEGEPGAWRVWFNPWYVQEMEFRCSRILLNGAEVVGRGRHPQDDLPKRPAEVPSVKEGGDQPR